MYKNEPSIPSLPIPDINDTLKRYHDSQKACLNEQDYKNFKEIYDKFISENRHNHFQEKFIKKYITENHSETPLDDDGNPRNWLEKLWQEEAYTKFRGPLYYLNYGGAFSNPREDFVKGTTKNENAIDYDMIAYQIYGLSKFWQRTINEQVQPQEFRGTKWSMDMWRKFWNASHLPGDKIDQLSFKLSSKNPINHFTILINGIVHILPMCDGEGKVYSREMFRQAIQNIVESEVSKDGNEKLLTEPIKTPTIFTADLLYRHDAHTFRKSLNENSLKNLKKVDDSAFVFTIDVNDNIKNSQDVIQNVVCGNGHNRVHNKNFSLVYFKSGHIGTYSCHSMCEGMSNLFAGMEIEKTCQFEKSKDKENADADGEYSNDTDSDDNNTDCPKSEFLEFTLPDSFIDQLQKAEAIYRNHFANNLKAKLLRLPIGKKTLRPFKIHPQALFQLSIQLAFYKLNQGATMPSTYETAQLRQFYNGRTETCRTFRESSKKWILAMCDKNSSKEVLKSTFIAAHTDYLMNMMETCNFKGFDRHLLALDNLDEECELTKHYTYKEGGASNFYLSTSTVGNIDENALIQAFCGGAAPFRDDGYAVFSSYSENFLNVSIWAYKNNDKSSLEGFAKALQMSIEGIIKGLSG